MSKGDPFSSRRPTMATMSKRHSSLLSRREATQGILLAFGGILGGATTFVAGCGGSSTSAATTSGSSGSSGTTTGDGGTSSNTDSSTATTDSGGSAGTWASGGTAAMTAKASYPNPFSVAATSCVVAATATAGPCTEAADQVRQDVSEGYAGLPMRLALRVVDAACNPVAGATVKIWHTQLTGSYSGDTPNPGICLAIQTDSAKHYFRGLQTTDADGRVDFDSCFPGWYRGRAIHIHYTVTHDGKSYTSQLVFDQTLIDEIFTTHAEYKGFGLPDTPNASDNVVGNANLASYTLATARMTDGAMLASKQLVVNV
jgi:protocatechuate 3,4-dioxygenase beta subunit